MGLRDGFRTARQVRKMMKESKQQAETAQQPSAEEIAAARQAAAEQMAGMDVDEIRRMVQELPQGSGPEAMQAQIEFAQRLQRMQGGSAPAPGVPGPSTAAAPDAGGAGPDAVQELIDVLPADAVVPAELGLQRGALAARFSAEAYGPGDTVAGVLVARRDIKAREVRAELRYFDESTEYRESVTHGVTGPLHVGDLAAGTELPFSLQLPREALPGWESAGPIEVVSLGPLTAEKHDALARGRLYWAVVGKADVPRAKDVETITPLPLKGEAGIWPGPESVAGPLGIEREGKGWDVEIEPGSWSVRRGKELTVDLVIGNPDVGRTSLRVGLLCQVYWDQDSPDGGEGTSRRTRYDEVLEQWAPIDPGMPQQSVTLTVPAGGPFSYRHDPGGAFGFEWKLIAREDKRARRDPRREATIQVLP